MSIKDTANRVKKSKDARTLVSNFGYLSLLQIAGYVFPLITMPYLARVIGVEGFGKIAFANAIIVWFQTIADWGFNFTATREVARCRDDKERVSTIFSNVLWARLLLMVASFIVLTACVLIIPQFRENAAIILISFLIIPGHIMFPEWFFQALERMKYITIFNFAIKILFTAAIFVFIQKPNDYMIHPLLTSGSYLLCGIVAIYLIIHKWGYGLKRSSWQEVTSTIKGSTDVFINNICPSLYNSFSSIFLGFVGGTAANGILDAGAKFVDIAQKFMSVLSRTFFPFLSRRIDKHYIFTRINILLAAVITIVLFFGAPLIIKIFFTPEFDTAIPILRIMSLSIIFLSLTSVYGTNYLIVTGHERPLRQLTTWVSLCGLVMAIILVKSFGVMGAAITITATRGALGFGSMILARHIKRQSEK